MARVVTIGFLYESDKPNCYWTDKDFLEEPSLPDILEETSTCGLQPGGLEHVQRILRSVQSIRIDSPIIGTSRCDNIRGHLAPV